MKATELMGYLTHMPDNVDLVVLDREEYDRLNKKAFLYEELKKFFKKCLTNESKCDIITS